MIRYSRLLSPRYGDGYSAPTISITGRDLPNSRLVSLIAFGEGDVADPQFTLVNMQFGQIMTHDMSMLAGSTQSSKFTFMAAFFQTCFFMFLIQRNAMISFSILELFFSARKTFNTMLFG